MAVVSLFTFASLTDGRTVRDLPKQHREKKTCSLVSQRVQPNPEPGSAAVGECHRNFLIFKRIKSECACLHEFRSFMVSLHTSHMTANVGPNHKNSNSVFS